MDTMKQALLEGLRELDIHLPEATADTLCAFAQAMLRQNQVMNLTAITEPSAVARLHLLDSLTVIKALEPGRKTLIDVGCGAGPGLVGWISGWLEKSMSQISALKTGIGVAICFPLLMLLGILLLRKSSRH